VSRVRGAISILRPLPISLAIGITAAVLIFFSYERSDIFTDSLLYRLELKVLDAKFLARGKTDIDPSVVIAAGDERTIGKFGRWGTWDRGEIAQVVENLFKAEADVVALDMVIADRAGLDIDRTEALREEIESFTELTGSEETTPEAIREAAGRFQERMGNLLEGEERLESVFDEYANNTVQGFIAEPEDEGMAAGRDDEELTEVLEPFVIEGYAHGIEIKTIDDPNASSGAEQVFVAGVATGDEKASDLTTVRAAQGEIVLPLERYRDVASYIGYFSLYPDPDGVFRRLPLVFRKGDTFLPSLSLQTAAAHFGGNPILVQDANQPTGLAYVALPGEAGKYEHIPVERDGSVLINYFGPSSPAADGGVFEHISMADIYDDKFDKTLVKGKVVIVAVTAIGTFDQRVTPFSSNAPGVEVHAAALQSILSGRTLVRGQDQVFLEMLLALIGAVFLGLTLRRIPISLGTLLVLLMMITWFTYDIVVAFGRFDVWHHQLVLQAQMLFTWAGITLYGYLAEGREKQLLKKEFSTVLAPTVVDELLKNPELAGLGGAEKELTVMFSDIRGFTSISEKMTPDGLTQFLNEYLTPMTEILMERRGTLDKYMGDAIMAFWGAPVEQPDHAVRACLAALDMMEKLEILQAKWISEGKPPIDIGIGLNSGLMRVGFMGSERMRNYTLLGDNVNLGSRLEGVNKQYGTNIIISEYTVGLLGGACYCRELDAIRVKGKHEPVTIFELRGAGEPPPDEKAFIDKFHEALAQYKGKNFEEAKASFEACLEMVEDDFTCKMYVERSEAFLAEPPPEDWDGVFVMKTK
jgi:adenylate cyclase